MKRTIGDHRPASPAEENADWLKFFADDELTLAESPLIGLDGAPALQAREPAANPLPASPLAPGEGVGANDELMHSHPNIRSSKYPADWEADPHLSLVDVSTCCSPDDILRALDRTAPSVSEVSIRLEGLREVWTVADGFREEVARLLRSKPSISTVHLSMQTTSPALRPLMLALEAADSIRNLTLVLDDWNPSYYDGLPVRCSAEEIPEMPATTKLTALALDIGFCPGEDVQMDLEDCATFVSSSKSLCCLKITTGDVGIDVSALSEALAAHPSLQRVHFCMSAADPAQQQLLCEGLVSCKSITHLHLDAGVPTRLSIAPLFKCCPQLRYFGLYFTDHDYDTANENSENAREILEELPGNTTLERFELLGQFVGINPDESEDDLAIVRAANEIMRRNRLLAKSADAGDSIAWMTGFQQQHLATLPGNDGSVPFVPSEVGAQIAEAVVNMLPVDEAERVFAGLRMRDIRESR